MVMKAELVAAFAKYGKGPSDGVTLNELSAVLTRSTSGGTQLTTEQASKVFAAFDTAGCGTVLCELFAATWTKEPIDRTLLLQGIFDMVDYDFSGRLSVSEFTALADAQAAASVAMQKLGLEIFGMVDTSGDGTLQLAEFERFNLETFKELTDAEFSQQASVWLKLAMTRTSIDRSKMLSNTFNWCDVNSDGVLSLEEFTALSKSQDKQSVAMQEAVFKMADTSGDGLLQEDEFVQFNLETAKALTDFAFAQQLRVWTKLAKAKVSPA